MIHKISELCDKIDSVKSMSDRLRQLKYGEKKAPRHIIDESIANRGNYTFQIYASPLVLQNTGDALFVGTGDFESTGAGATCTFIVSGWREV